MLAVVIQHHPTDERINHLGVVCQEFFKIASGSSSKVINIHHIKKGDVSQKPRIFGENSTKYEPKSKFPDIVKLHEITNDVTDMIPVSNGDEDNKYIQDTFIPTRLPNIKKYLKVNDGLTIVYQSNMAKENIRNLKTIVDCCPNLTSFTPFIRVSKHRHHRY